MFKVRWATNAISVFPSFLLLSVRWLCVYVFICLYACERVKQLSVQLFNDGHILTKIILIKFNGFCKGQTGTQSKFQMLWIHFFQFIIEFFFFFLCRLVKYFVFV